MNRRQILGMVGAALIALVGVRADAGDARVKASKAASACCCEDTCCCGDACANACCCGLACCGDGCCCDMSKAATVKTVKGKSCCENDIKSAKNAKESCCATTAAKAVTSQVKIVR